MCEHRAHEAVQPEHEPDFAEGHTRPTYEAEETDSPSATPGDESVPPGPVGEPQDRPKRLL